MVIMENKKLNVYDKKYWNNKYEKNDVYYAAPLRRKVIDYVKYYHIPEIDAIANELIVKCSLKANLPDAVPYAVMVWLKEKFDKSYFRYQAEKREDWRKPDHTLEIRYGDCDDYMILEYFLIRAIFKKLSCWEKNKHRLKCVDGHTHHDQPFYPYGGRHAYLIWLNEYCQWMTVETTFYLDIAISSYFDLEHKDKLVYTIISYTFNEQYSWTPNNVILEKNNKGENKMSAKKKKWYQSKTVWANVAVVVGGISLAMADQFAAGGAITVASLVNLVLRVVSNTELKW